MLPRSSVEASPVPRSLVIVHANASAIYFKTCLLSASMCAVLGQFLPQLCRYCADVHDMDHTLDEFFIYEFAKVRNLPCFSQSAARGVLAASHLGVNRALPHLAAGGL